jgi:hypothetical protein
MDALAEGARKLGKPDLVDGVMTFDYFVTAMKFINNYLVPQLVEVES